MGTIKFEIDLPEFEKELSINVTIHRDGEVVYSTTSSPSMGSTFLTDFGGRTKENDVTTNSAFSSIVDDVKNASSDEKETIKESKPKKTSTNKRAGGNFMDLDI